MASDVDDVELEEENGLSRRELLGIGAVVGVGLVGSAVPVLRYLGPSALAAAAPHFEVPIDMLGLWQAQRLLIRGAPGYLLRTPDEIVACSAICTHLGCVTKWNRTQRVFFCPCHGARFAPDGRVLGGPAPSPLKRYEVVVSEGKARCVEPV